MTREEKLQKLVELSVTISDVYDDKKAAERFLEAGIISKATYKKIASKGKTSK